MSENEKLFDAMVRIACGEIVAEEVAAYDNLDLSESSFSSAFEQRMAEFIRSAGRMKNRKCVLRSVLIAAAILVLLTTAVMAVPRVREQVINTLVEITGYSAHFTYQGTDPSAESEPPVAQMDITSRTPRYLPAGYTETDTWESTGFLMVVYANEQGDEIEFSRSINNEGTLVSVDSEHSDYSKTTIGGHTAHLFATNDETYPSHVVLIYNNETICASGYVSVGELIQMVNSLF